MVTPREIVAQWDRNAQARCRQLEIGKDLSHDKVLVPVVMSVAGNLRGRSVLDVGCGCGFLTRIVARSARHVVGVDISRGMIDEAMRRFGQVANMQFEASSIEAFARKTRERFDVCVSNMALMTTPDLDNALNAVRMALRPGRRLVFSIAHPCFWNFYRKDEASTQFNYWKPHSVTAPFRISLSRNPLPVPTTYFHRPLSMYVSSLIRADFMIEAFVEPKVSGNLPKLYRRHFRFPRFMVVAAER